MVAEIYASGKNPNPAREPENRASRFGDRASILMVSWKLDAVAVLGRVQCAGEHETAGIIFAGRCSEAFRHGLGTDC